jgi:hypothetical protein
LLPLQPNNLVLASGSKLEVNVSPSEVGQHLPMEIRKHLQLQQTGVVFASVHSSQERISQSNFGNITNPKKPQIVVTSHYPGEIPPQMQLLSA